MLRGESDCKRFEFSKRNLRLRLNRLKQILDLLLLYLPLNLRFYLLSLLLRRLVNRLVISQLHKRDEASISRTVPNRGGEEDALLPIVWKISLIP